MNYIQRCMVSLRRNPGKTIVLFLVVFLLGNVISGALAITQSVDTTVDKLFQNIPIVTTAELDYEKINETIKDTGGEIYEYADDIKLMSSQTIETIGSLPCVSYYNYSLDFIGLISDNYYRPADVTNPLYSPGEIASFPLQNGNDPEVYDLRQGYIRLVSGRTFNQEEMDCKKYAALISQTNAEINQLGIGSVMELFAENEVTDEKTVYPLEIVGIFEPSIEDKHDPSYDYEGMIEHFNDAVYIPYKLAEQIHSSMYGDLEEEEKYPSSRLKYHKTFFVLNNITKLDEFCAQTEEILQNDNCYYYKIVTS